MGSNVSTPAPRSMAAEGRDTLQAQLDLAPEVLAARQRYDPAYADLNIDVLRRSLFGADGKPGLLDTYRDAEPTLTDFTARAQTGQRERDITDVERFGGRATAALRESDPAAAALEDKLAAQASADLDAGASLPAGLANQVSQSVRSAQAARGFGFGNADASVEGLFLGREANAMQQQRRGFASNVAAQRRATTGDPFMAILGRPSSVPGQAMTAVGQGGSAAAGAPNFDPWSSYGADLHNTNFNASAAAKIAQANNDTAITAAGIGAAGSAASAL